VVVAAGVPKIVFVVAAAASRNVMAAGKLVEEGTVVTVAEEQKAPLL
jgi:ABC-type dipeptide/oligopeptide/nickel transport system ATPase component